MSATARGLRRVGIFGGSFNPPHLGHRELCESLLGRELVDELWVVPVFDHPFGKELASFADRLEMCRLAFAGLPGVRVSTIEERLGGRSYTVRTLEALRRELPEDEIYLVVGADALREADHWREFERVKEMAKILVVPRRGEPSAEAIDIPPPMEVSSREIRHRLETGLPVAGLVSPEVAAYIERSGLYRAAPPAAGRAETEASGKRGDER